MGRYNQDITKARHISSHLCFFKSWLVRNTTNFASTSDRRKTVKASVSSWGLRLLIFRSCSRSLGTWLREGQRHRSMRPHDNWRQTAEHQLMTNARLLIKPREFVLWSAGSSTITEHSETEQINSFNLWMQKFIFQLACKSINVAEYGNIQRKGYLGLRQNSFMALTAVMKLFCVYLAPYSLFFSTARTEEKTGQNISRSILSQSLHRCNVRCTNIHHL